MTNATYSSKSNASRAARAALGETALFTTDKTPTGWTWAPMDPTPSQDAVEAELARMDAAEVEAERTGADVSALFEAATSDQLSPGLAAAGLAEAMGGPLADEAVAEDRAKADPLVVDGFRHGNATRANDARRAKVGRERASREGFPKAGKVQVTTPAPKAPSKAGALVELAKREEGVTADELREASGWTKLGGFYGAVQRANLDLHSMREGSTTRFFAAAPTPERRVYVRRVAGGSWTFLGLANRESDALAMAGGTDMAVDTGKGGQYLVAPRASVG